MSGRGRRLFWRRYSSPMESEYAALALAALILTVVLVTCFMCIQLYRLRKPPPTYGGAAPPSRDPFLGRFYYAPACGAGDPYARAACHGVTAGAMPSIEVGGARGGGLCPGGLGVPP